MHPSDEELFSEREAGPLPEGGEPRQKRVWATGRKSKLGEHRSKNPSLWGEG